MKEDFFGPSTSVPAHYSGLLCDVYNTTEPGDSDCTRISIMDSTRVPDWLDARQTALQSIKDL